MNIEQVFTKARQLGDGAGVEVSLATNQPGGIVSYATGMLTYYPAIFNGAVFRLERLSTTGAEPLKYYFSDRKRQIDPQVPGTFGTTPRQPFNADAIDRLGLSLSRSGSGIAAKFTLLSWQNATFTVVLNPLGDLLVGLGPCIGNAPGQAGYMLAFGAVLPKASEPR
jgi:hypothetical protein